jgi:hypothetical protein
VGDAEPLFLVDHDQPEPFEAQVPGQQRMRADGNIDRAVGDAGPGRGGLFGRHETRQRPDADGKAANRSAKVLACWRASSVVGATTATCSPAMAALQSRAHRHLGLAKADIAADQPIHRPAAGEVFHDRLDGGQLIVGFSPGKAGRERLPQRAGRLEHGRLLTARAAAVRISRSAISRSLSFSLALRACQAPPPSLSRGAVPSP